MLETLTITGVKTEREGGGLEVEYKIDSFNTLIGKHLNLSQNTSHVRSLPNLHYNKQDLKETENPLDWRIYGLKIRDVMQWLNMHGPRC